MIHRLRDMIGSAQAAESHPTLGYVRAVPCPFYGGLFDRLRDACAVVTGKAFAVRWPKGGELEAALCEEKQDARLRTAEEFQKARIDDAGYVTWPADDR